MVIFMLYEFHLNNNILKWFSPPALLIYLYARTNKYSVEDWKVILCRYFFPCTTVNSTCLRPPGLGTISLNQKYFWPPPNFLVPLLQLAISLDVNWNNLGLTSFFSSVPNIIVLQCPVFNVWKQLFYVRCLVFSYLGIINPLFVIYCGQKRKSSFTFYWSVSHPGFHVLILKH